MLVNNRSGDTVGRRLRSVSNLRRSSRAICLEWTKPFGIDVWSRNSCSPGGILVVDAEGAPAGTAARRAAALAGAFFLFFFFAIDPPGWLDALRWISFLSADH
jgi:hypothetical protein